MRLEAQWRLHDSHLLRSGAALQFCDAWEYHTSRVPCYVREMPFVTTAATTTASSMWPPRYLARGGQLVPRKNGSSGGLRLAVHVRERELQLE